MRILITGGHGFIGRHLTLNLLKKGHKVFLYDHKTALNFPSDLPRPEDVTGDITKWNKTRDAFSFNKPEIVFHLAAITGVMRCLENEKETLETNILGTYNVTKATAECGASKLIFASSREVYGETIGESTSEEDPTKPNNLYGLTKLIGEKIVKWNCAIHDLNYTILRIANVYGPGGEKYGIHQILQKISSGGEVTVMGGSQCMNFIYISDLVDALCETLENPKSDNQVFNIGGPDTITIQEVITLISNLIGQEVSIKKAPMRPTETIRFIPDTIKAKKILGWSPKVRLQDGLRLILPSSND